MKRIKHQLRSVVILVIMLSIILSSIPVYASELDETTIIKQSVLSFAELFSDKQLAISKMIPIINLEQELIGYSVCLESNEIEYGYVNYEFDKENPITDFSIGEGNVYLDESAEIAHETVLVSMGKGSYELLATSANNSYTAYSSLEAIFSKNYIYSATVLTAPKYTSKYSSAKSLLSEEYITRLTGKYACTVVALTEIAYQEGILYNGSLRSTFDKLWNDTLTSVAYVKNAFSYGSTMRMNEIYGMKDYLNDMGKGNSVVTSQTFPQFKFFQDIVDSNASGTLTYTLYKTDGNTDSHTVSVVGYCSVMLNGVIYNYLIVADGWHDDAPRYVAYNRVDFVNTSGVKYVIK
ncbi:MAG: hypothetical protein IJ419_02675 [Agathobacter sp.]|nr:hypothetical protein [Agathobacter sp.]